MATEVKESIPLVRKVGRDASLDERPLSSAENPGLGDGTCVRARLRRRRPLAVFVVALGLLVAAIGARARGTLWPAPWIRGVAASDPSMVLPAETEIINRVGMKFVLIAPGAFLMGSANRDDDLDGDEIPHRVRIATPFYLAVFEVTVGQFRQFAEATGYVTDAEKDSAYSSQVTAHPLLFDTRSRPTWRTPGFPQADDHPVVRVSANDAQAFIEWLSRTDEREYRLPTEAEWEYACRAGSTTRFSMGEEAQSVRIAANLWGAGAEPASDGSRDRFRFTSPVGSFPPNGFGLYDMHGNAWEWCSDWYQSDYYGESPSSDPQGPARGSQRVTRGGSYYLEPRHARSANRASAPPHYHSYDIGFRVALGLSR